MRPTFDVLVISDGAPELVPRLARALEGSRPGRCAVLVRGEKALGAAALIELARALRPLTHRYGAALLVSDRIDVALAADADGVHLPEAGLNVEEARRLLGPQRLVGASRHDARGVHAAALAQADYATLSPVYASPGKGPPLLARGFRAIAQATPLALFALGGVGTGCVPELVEAGAAGVAVVRDVLAAPDPSRALRALLDALDAARALRPGRITATRK